jgi:(hydroxyamino)benzene mutase
LLVILGLAWRWVALGPTASRVAFGLVVYAAFANWATLLLAAAWGAGATTLPLAGRGMTGSTIQEQLIAALLITLAVAMVAGVVLLIVGVWRTLADRGGTRDA